MWGARIVSKFDESEFEKLPKEKARLNNWKVQQLSELLMQSLPLFMNLVHVWMTKTPSADIATNLGVFLSFFYGQDEAEKV